MRKKILLYFFQNINILKIELRNVHPRWDFTDGAAPRWRSGAGMQGMAGGGLMSVLLPTRGPPAAGQYIGRNILYRSIVPHVASSLQETTVLLHAYVHPNTNTVLLCPKMLSEK